MKGDGSETKEELDARIEELDKLIYCARDNLNTLITERMLCSIFSNHKSK